MMVLTLSGSFDRQERATAAAQPARLGSVQALQEWDLVQRAQQFDASALAWLYQVYHPKIYNYAFLQLGNAQLAEDVASDVMVKVIESIGGFRFRGAPFAAWVFRIARNRIIDMHRRRRRRGEVQLDKEVAGREDPTTSVEQALDRGHLQAALSRLTEEQRQVIVLRFIEGFDNASVARVLGRSQGSIKSLQHRALASLRRILTEEGS
ncbi:MAG: RNA polymerase sigma factor [Dehalococcoidia bacterium]